MEMIREINEKDKTLSSMFSGLVSINRTGLMMFRGCNYVDAMLDFCYISGHFTRKLNIWQEWYTKELFYS